MEHWVQSIAEFFAAMIELIGIAMLTVLVIYSVGWAAVALLQGTSRHQIWQDTRQRLGRSILLGLEILIVADIIHTVAVELTFETVFVLGLIVLIRTFLSFTLEVELTGNWPWQNKGGHVVNENES